MAFFPESKSHSHIHLHGEEDLNDQRIAFVEYQIEVKHLRKENQKLREALTEERTNRKDFEEKFLEDNSHRVRQMERHLSAERAKWKERTYQAARQSDVLAKQLSLAKRELDSLRVQVRKLQAENTVYKRNLSAPQRQPSPSPYAYTARNPPMNSSIPSTYHHSTCRKHTDITETIFTRAPAPVAQGDFTDEQCSTVVSEEFTKSDCTA
ncbi:hypothetical protein RvY_10930 [Ramazzottius varieornatus]|uniref:Uncharacterized protein n=1 Tax=Ramazzottius varieornatus TaxID=947166 RepID=A0A1D1VGV2_RAMVA|nr:hypothetical protein RvY_10930 [Ramazzottius varieornatus]